MSIDYFRIPYDYKAGTNFTISNIWHTTETAFTFVQKWSIAGKIADEAQ